MQMGAFVGNTIARELHAKAHGLATPTREVFVYTDKGSMAIIGRNRAVASVGSLRFSGYLAFLLWAFVHILSLIGFRRKLTVFAEWVWQYFFGTRGVRLITAGRHEPRLPSEAPSQTDNE